MKNKGLIIAIAAGLAAAAFLIMAITAKQPADKPVATTEKNQKKIDNHSLLNQGRQCEKEGRYLEARSLYWKAMEEASDNEIIKEAEEAFYSLNMKVLFSPIITEQSRKYAVEKGDTLAKIAKKFNTTVELLMRSNQLTSDLIRPGMELKVSLAKYSIVIDRSQNLLILKSNDQILKTYKVSTGENESTPLGKFEIINKLVNPTWYSAKAVVPAGSPENILGSRWIGISKAGYGIHGTTQPETVGMHVTAGCIRMLDKDVEELYAIIPVGTEVTIVN